MDILNVSVFLNFLRTQTIDIVYTVAAIPIFFITVEYARQRMSWVKKHWENKILQPAIAAGFAIIPGCGGDATIIRDYGRGIMSFAALVVLSQVTLGDAVFYLIAKDPWTIVWLQIFILLPIGLILGYTILLLSKLKLPKSERLTIDVHRFLKMISTILRPIKSVYRFTITAFDRLYYALSFHYLEKPVIHLLLIYSFWFFTICAFIPSALWWMGMLEQEKLSGNLFLWIAAIELFLSFLLWMLAYKHQCENSKSFRGLLCDVAVESGSLIFTIFLVVTFIEASIQMVGINVGPYANYIILAAAIGLLPNCGLQIAMATLYFEGAIGGAAFVACISAQDGEGSIQLVRSAGWRPALPLFAIRFLVGIGVGYGYQIFSG